MMNHIRVVTHRSSFKIGKYFFDNEIVSSIDNFSPNYAKEILYFSHILQRS